MDVDRKTWWRAGGCGQDEDDKQDPPREHSSLSCGSSFPLPDDGIIPILESNIRLDVEFLKN